MGMPIKQQKSMPSQDAQVQQITASLNQMLQNESFSKVIANSLSPAIQKSLEQAMRQLWSAMQDASVDTQQSVQETTSPSQPDNVIPFSRRHSAHSQSTEDSETPVSKQQTFVNKPVEDNNDTDEQTAENTEKGEQSVSPKKIPKKSTGSQQAIAGQPSRDNLPLADAEKNTEENQNDADESPQENENTVEGEDEGSAQSEEAESGSTQGATPSEEAEDQQQTERPEENGQEEEQEQQNEEQGDTESNQEETEDGAQNQEASPPSQNEGGAENERESQNAANLHREQQADRQQKGEETEED
ncbi:MAG TPA: hypothetical protein VJB65_01945, partial [Patescibacteria group bacterium]|nr:hypothetical protein [Patescibacteria group bacterium]